MRNLILLVGVMMAISSCQNIAITKRTYRSGFHVSKIGKKNRSYNRADQTVVSLEDSDILQYPEHNIPSLSASITDRVELDRNPDKVQVGHDLIDLRVLNEHTQRSPFDPETAFLKSVSQTKNRAATKAVIANVDYDFVEVDKQEYSKWALAGFALGLGGMVFIILAFVFLVSLYSGNYTSTLHTSAYIGAIGGALQSFGGIFFGIAGAKLAKAEGKRGKGLATTGKVLGIVGAALSAIVGLIGAIGGAFLLR